MDVRDVMDVGDVMEVRDVMDARDVTVSFYRFAYGFQRCNGCSHMHMDLRDVLVICRFVL